MNKRLTKQRWEEIISAMAYYETMLDENETDAYGRDPFWTKRRRNYESAMEWLLSLNKWTDVKGEQQ